MGNQIEPCVICEDYMVGVKCDKDQCPVALYKKEAEKWKREAERLKSEMSYMHGPNEIGDAHEMGAW